MSTFKFEIIITDDDIDGDEYWEDALKKDGTGISVLRETIQNSLVDTFMLEYTRDEEHVKDFKERIVLKEFSD